MGNIYKEIQDDKAEEDRLAKIREENEAKITEYEQDVKNLNGDIAALRQKKRLFGLLGPSQDTLGEIAVVMTTGLAILALIRVRVGRNARTAADPTETTP